MTQEEKILEILNGSAFLRSRDLEKLGLPRTALIRLVRKGEVVRAQRGLYMKPGGPETEHISLLEVAKKVPGGVICLPTALRFHGIGTQEPYQVWIAIGRKSRKPRMINPRLRIFRFSDASLLYGVEEHKILGTTLRITSPAKTVADCFKYRNKVGLDVALEAGKDCIRSRKATISEIYECAKVCRVAKIIKPYLEAWQY
jgi:predicted transcriptional regulator of viral defense system